MTSPQTDTTTTAGEPEPIKAVPLRRPGQWIAAVIILVLAGLFVYGAATNKAYAWGTYADYLFDQRVLSGVGYTLALTVLAMTIAIVLGVALAIMRLSPNPVLRGTAWVYLWIFRGTPVYVQLVFWGLFPAIYKQIDVGI
ncbi:ABC transporter permease subunit, partial [Gordonia alkanivorans]